MDVSALMGSSSTFRGYIRAVSRQGSGTATATTSVFDVNATGRSILDYEIYFGIKIVRRDRRTGEGVHYMQTCV